MSRNLFITEEKQWYEYGPVDYQLDGDGESSFGKDDILAALNEGDGDGDGDGDGNEEEINLDDDPSPDDGDEDEDTGKGKEEEEDEEGKEDDDEENKDGKDDEDEELEFDPLSRKKLLKDFPDIFKKYPMLEKSYYGYQKYRELFPTYDDLKEAAAKVETLDKYTEELQEGSFKGLLEGLKEENPENFTKLVDNYMTNLKTVDPEAFFHVIANMTKTTIISMARTGKEKKNKDLLTAANILNEFMFGEGEFEPPVSFGKKDGEPDADKTKLQKEREEFENQKLTSRQSEIKESVDSRVLKAVRDRIDPNEAMTPFTRKMAVNEAITKANEIISGDKFFNSTVKKMWDSAKKAGYPASQLQKIREAHISKIKTVLPQVIKTVRADALKGSGKKGKVREEEVMERETTRKPTGDSRRHDNSGSRRDLGRPQKGESTLDFLRR